jgi:Leucine-rich repeat (LRR) protein
LYLQVSPGVLLAEYEARRIGNWVHLGDDVPEDEEWSMPVLNRVAAEGLQELRLINDNGDGKTYNLGIAPLHNCVNLQKLYIEGSVIYEEPLPLLAGCAQLQELCIQGRSISDLTPIQGCLQLTKLWIFLVNDDDQDDDLTQFQGFVQLRDLNLSYLGDGDDDGFDGFRGVSSLEGIQACSKLERLDMSCQPDLEDLAPLSACVRLQDLDISHCSSVQDLSPLSSSANLKKLDMRGCINVTSVEPLQACANLEVLCCGSRTMELSGLAALKAALPRLSVT